MKKSLITSISIMMAMLIFSGCGNSQNSNDTVSSNQATKDNSSKSLNIFTWDTYVPQDIIDSYSELNNVKVNYANFESNEEMLTKLEANNAGDYDIVIASDYIIDIARKKGNILAELDKSKLYNYNNIDPNFQSQYYDPENKYTIPWGVGTPLIVYDPDVVKLDIKGYADLWNSELKDSIVMMDDSRNVIGITLKTLGKSFNETDSKVLEEAKQKLMDLKPNIRALSYDNPQNLLISGEASVGYVFTSQVVAAIAENSNLEVVYPEEGMGFGIDSIFVPLNAPNKDNAHSFINYILDGEVSAKIYPQINYICPNKAASEFLPDEYKNNRGLYIPSNVLGQTEFIQDIGTEATAIYDKIWTEFKQQ